MAKNISLLGADYPDVPAVQLPQTGGGVATFYDVEVTDGDPTLAWGTRSTVGTVQGTDLHVTMPANPNTWKACSKTQEGYVPKGQGNADKIWATDANGNPGWMGGKLLSTTVTGTTNSNGIYLSSLATSHKVVAAFITGASGIFFPYNNIWVFGTIEIGSGGSIKLGTSTQYTWTVYYID